MSNIEQIDFSTLIWVKKELDETLKRAQVAIEKYVDNPEDENQLQFCATYLHQVQGTLKMVELFGAAMVAEEMEQVAIKILNKQVDSENDAFEVLMRGIILLPDYLERIQLGHKDIPMVLLPLVNDLRTVKGDALLSESALFNPDLSLGIPQSNLNSTFKLSETQLNQVVKKIRAAYQSCLLNWLKGNEVDSNLKKLQIIVDKLKTIITPVEKKQLFWVAGGLFEALIHGGLEKSVTVKQLCARLDQAIRILTSKENSEDRLYKKLTTNILYYVALADSKDRRTQEIQTFFNLSDFISDDKEIENAQNSLSGKNRELLESVTGVIKEDLLSIQENLDLYNRNENASSVDLQAISSALNKVSDTIGIIGIGSARSKINTVIEKINENINQDKKIDKDTIMNVAETLLFVESSLDENIDSLGEVKEASNKEESAIPASEMRKVLDVLAKESINNLQKVKHNFVVYIESPWNKTSIETSPKLLNEIGGALEISGFKDVSKEIFRIENFTTDYMLNENYKPTVDQLDLLAESIASLEYYLEYLSEGTKGEESILTLARTNIDKLYESIDKMPISENVDEGEEEIDKSLDLLSDDEFDLNEDSDEVEIGLDEEIDEVDISLEDDFSVEFNNEIEDTDLSILNDNNTLKKEQEGLLVAFSEDTDDDIKEVFLEEFEEELEHLNLVHPKWKRNPEEKLELLAEIRRIYHTLKGSGRLVGALAIGDFSWKIEELTNRVLNKSLDMSDSYIQVMQSSADILPDLYEALKNSSVVPDGYYRVIENAERVINGEPLEEAVLEQKDIDVPDDNDVDELLDFIDIDENEDENENASEKITEDDLSIDPVFVEILQQEVEGHLADITDYINNCKENYEYKTTEKFIRVVHTLNGAANMASVKSIVEMTTPIELTSKMLNELNIDFDEESLGKITDFKNEATLIMSDLSNKSKSSEISTAIGKYFRDKLEELESLSLEDEIVEVKLEESSEDISLDGDFDLSQFINEAEESDEEVNDLDNFIEEATEELSQIDDSDVTLEVNDLSIESNTVNEINELSELTAETNDLEFSLDNELDGLVNENPENDIGSYINETSDSSENYESSLEENNEVIDKDTKVNNEVVNTDEVIEQEKTLELQKDITQSEDNTILNNASEDNGHLEQDDDYDITLDDINFDELLEDSLEDELVEKDAVDDLTLDELIIKDTVKEVNIEDDLSIEERVIDDLSIDELFLEEPVIENLEIEELVQEDSVQEEPVQEEPVQKEPVQEEPVVEQITVQNPIEIVDTSSRDDVHISAVASGKSESDDYTDESTGDFDEELLEIFNEEADEILDRTEHVLSDLVDSPEDISLIRALQRDLHTLKGGARMAGLENIGELSHVLESLLETIGEDNRTVDQKTINAIHDSFDLLNDMMDTKDYGNQSDISEVLNQVKNLVGLEDGMIPEESKLDQDFIVDVNPLDSKISQNSTPENDDVEIEQHKKSNVLSGNQIKVNSELLDNLVNYAGEVSIFRSRLEQEIGSFRLNLSELGNTVSRIKEQLRKLDVETEAQIISTFQTENDDEGFDPLEMDRFSQLQQLSRSLTESVSDLTSIHSYLDDVARTSDNLLTQQSRVNTELQEGLMETRLVSFNSIVPRLRRLVRTTSNELNKPVKLEVLGAEGEMDKTVLEGVIAPLEHMLRNSLAHGIEQNRGETGKSKQGQIVIDVRREATEVVISISDDGAGINRQKVMELARERGLIKPGTQLSNENIDRLILHSGFSTVDEVSKLAGRGVGMDVVGNQINILGGSLDITSDPGKGTKFSIKLPYTLALSNALLVEIDETVYAVPVSGLEGIIRMSYSDYLQKSKEPNAVYEYANEEYQLQELNNLLSLDSEIVVENNQIPLVMIRSGDSGVALRVDRILGSREIVVKAVGIQVSSVPGIYGATILGDGNVVLILDIIPLSRSYMSKLEDLDGSKLIIPEEIERDPLIMIVDDSITMRKVGERILRRNDYDVITAKDGLDALDQLKEAIPDVMLLDIEMPRMDGYELAIEMKKEAKYANIPIIMITSRTGDKHRQKAMDLGVDRYLGKPYQEADLLENISGLIELQES